MTVLWFALSWEYGEEYQGRTHTIIVACLNAVCLSVLWRLLFRGRRVPTYRTSAFFHVLLFAWLAWCAFPYLGETP